MEFRFNVNEIFKNQPIVEINQTLIPPGFNGDRRGLWDAVTKVSEIVNAVGEASASAQSLTKPITTAERLRNSEHTLYLLIDPEAQNGKGVISGMLKTGKKSLYVFDREGHHYQVQPPCILDFYVHESRQRSGLGKRLFEHMLKKEDVQPVKLAIDRPSDKFLAFLNKHYTLNNGIKQMNNYVVFDGFFPEMKEKSAPQENDSPSPMKIKQSANGLQTNYSSTYGRYGAPRPPCSMGQIIHNQSSTVTKANEPSGANLSQQSAYLEKPIDDSLKMTNLQNQGQGPQCLTNPLQTIQMQENRVPPEFMYQNPIHQQVYVKPQPQTNFNYQNLQQPINIPYNQEIPLQIQSINQANIPIQNYQIPPTNRQFNLTNNQTPFASQIDANQQQWQQPYYQQPLYTNQQQSFQRTQSQEEFLHQKNNNIVNQQANTIQQSNNAIKSSDRQEKAIYSPSYPLTYNNSTLISPILSRAHDSSQIPCLREQTSMKSISKPSVTKLSRTQSAKTRSELEFQQNNLVKVPRVDSQIQNIMPEKNFTISDKQSREYVNQQILQPNQQQNQQQLLPNVQQLNQQPLLPNQQQIQLNQQQMLPSEQQLQSNQQQLQSNQQQFQSNLQQLQPNQQQLQPNLQQLQPHVQQLQPNLQQLANQQEYLNNQQQLALNQNKTSISNQTAQNQKLNPMTQLNQSQNWQLNEQTIPQFNQQQQTQATNLQTTQNNQQQIQIPQLSQQYNSSRLNQSNTFVNENNSTPNQQQMNYLQSPLNQQHNPNNLMQSQYNQQQNYNTQDRRKQYYPIVQQYVSPQEQYMGMPNIAVNPTQTTKSAAPESINHNVNPQYINQLPASFNNNISSDQVNAILNDPNSNPMNKNPVQQNVPPNSSGDMQPYTMEVQHQTKQVNADVTQNTAKNEQSIYQNQTSSQSKLNPIIERQLADIRKDVHQVNENAKLERPNSLSIQQSEEEENIISTTIEDVKSEVKENVDGEEINDNNVIIIDDTENIKKVNDIVSDTSAKLSELNVSPNADQQTPSKKTPSHLTEQGFFDLKFYHNKLW